MHGRSSHYLVLQGLCNYTMQLFAYTNHMYLHKMAFIVSSSSPGKVPFFPLTVEHLISSSENNSFISSLRRRVGCLFALLKTVANDSPLINTPVFLTSSIFWTGAYRIEIDACMDVKICSSCIYIPFLFLHQTLWLPETRHINIRQYNYMHNLKYLTSLDRSAKLLVTNFLRFAFGVTVLLSFC